MRENQLAEVAESERKRTANEREKRKRETGKLTAFYENELKVLR